MADDPSSWGAKPDEGPASWGAVSAGQAQTPSAKGLYERLSEGQYPALYNPKTANLLPGRTGKPPQMRGLDLPTFAEGMGEAPGVTLTGAAAPFAAGALAQGTKGLGTTIFGKGVKDANLAQWFARGVATLGSERALYEFLKHHFGFADGGRVEGRAEGGPADDDLYSDPAFQSALAAKGPEQRPARLDVLRDALTPSYLRDTPSSPQADIALADPNAMPGKIGPPSGPPTAAQMIGGLGADVATNALPFGKMSAAALAKWLGGSIAFWNANPEKAALVDKLIEQGYGRQAIADHPDVQVGKASIGRYLDYSGQKTAAAENPGLWEANPGSVDQLKAWKAEGIAESEIARRLGTTPGNVAQKVKSLRNAGEFEGVELRASNQSKALLADPEKRADLIRLAKAGTSQGDIASYFFGGPGGKHPRRGHISQSIKQLQEEGELQGYTPQGGTGLTAAGKTPTLPQLRSTQGEAPLADPAYEKALRAHLGWKGGGRVMPAWWIKAKQAAKERQTARDSRSVHGVSSTLPVRLGRAEGGPAGDDDSARFQANFARNSAWTKPGAANFNTRLGQLEPAFRQWVKNNSIPFDPKSRAPQDYDMRGFWKAMRSGDPSAASAIDPNDSRLHYPDYWKTPYHETFSSESQWAAPGAPSWNDQDQLVTPTGEILFDDRAPKGRAEGGPTDDQDQALASSMTHWPEAPNPTIEETKRRLKLTGENLWNTWVAPAKRLGEAATSGTLDVTNPETAGDALGLVGSVAGARMPFAKAGELGSMMGGPLYHGSPELNLSKLRPSERGPLGPGVYTTPMEGLAQRYAGEVGKVYELPEQQRDVFLGHGHRTDEEWFGFKRDKERLLEAAAPDKREALGGILDKMWSSDGYPAFARISQLYGDKEAAQDLFKRAGFHGISGQVDGPEVLLFGEQNLGRKPDILPRNLGPARPNRPINEQTLSEMRGLQAELDRAGVKAPGRPINEQTLAEMRAIQAELDKGKRARGGRVPGELTEANKHSHPEVGYVSASPRKKQRCELCTKFISEDQNGPACRKVASPIAAGGWCRRFVLRT